MGGTLLFLGCEGDSSESIIRNVLLNVSGLYRPPSGNTTIVSGNTGAPVTQLDLRQTGDKLEAIDNNNLIFKGSIGRATEEQAGFTLNGQTTAGQGVTISGTITVPSGTGDGTMQATWIEPSLFAQLYAEASVPVNDPVSTNGTDGTDGVTTNGTDNGNGTVTNGTSDVSITPTSATIDVTDGTDLSRSFTASGGDGSYSWFISSQTLGTLTESGASATYTANEVTGIQSLTVFDGTGAQGNVVNITQQ
jgi:hypothetical protein